MKKRIPTEQEIAKRHKVSVDYVTRQAEIGSTVEREHTTSHEEAYGIALQHIAEFPNYYSHLLKMEKKLKKEWGNGKKSVKEEKEEVRYCDLCKKDETKSECSYGPDAWEMNTRKLLTMKENIIRRLIDKAKGRVEVGRTESGGRIYQSTKVKKSTVSYPSKPKKPEVKKSSNSDDPWLQGAKASGGAELKAHYRQLRGESKSYKEFIEEAKSVSFEIDPDHNRLRRQKKIRDLANRTDNPGEKAAAERKTTGPAYQKPKPQKTVYIQRSKNA